MCLLFVWWQLQKSMLCFVLMLLPRPWSGSSVPGAQVAFITFYVDISRGIKLDNARIARYAHIHGILVHSIMGILYCTVLDKFVRLQRNIFKFLLVVDIYIRIISAVYGRPGSTVRLNQY